MTLGDAIRRLAEAGATPEVIAIAVEEIEAARTGSLNARQARNRRYYQNHKRLNSDGFKTPQDASETVLKASETVLIKTPLARVEDNPSTKKLSGKGRKNIGAERLKNTPHTPRDFLLECLLPEAADAVLEHRRALRKPLTGRAAQLLAKGFLATADPNAAADMMIERGWQGFKPEWFENERRSNGQQRQGQSKRGSVSDVAASVIRRIDEQFAYLDEVRPAHGLAEGGPTVRMLPTQRGKRS
jgi:hypothetical protein